MAFHSSLYDNNIYIYMTNIKATVVPMEIMDIASKEYIAFS